MDSPVSQNPSVHISDLRDFYLKIEHNASTPSLRKKTTVVKYTKLPDFDICTKACQSLKPRLRRIIELDDPELPTSRSYKLGILPAPKMNTSTKRKIVTFTEDDDHRLTSNTARFASSTRRSSGTLSNDDKSAASQHRMTSPNTIKNLQESKTCPKPRNLSSQKDPVAPKVTIRNKQPVVTSQTPHGNPRSRTTKYKDQSDQDTKIVLNPPKVNLSKNIANRSESEKEIMPIKKDLVKSLSRPAPAKRISDRNRLNTRPQNRTKKDLFKELSSNKPVPVIHVPQVCDSKLILEAETPANDILALTQHYVECGTDTDNLFLPKDASVETNPKPTMVNEETETSNNTITTAVTQETFDSLDVPNVTLIKDKSNFAKKDIVSLCHRSLPNLHAPSFKISPEKEATVDPLYIGKSKTYIIGRATFTYTTKQKINIHVVGSSDDSQSNQSPSPLAYPLSVVSLFKNKLNPCEMSKSTEEDLPNERDKRSSCHKGVDERQAISRPNSFNNCKLVKPSDLISTIRVNNNLLHNDYISEQFQRELHFIDSFFESLQYLESCSLSEKCFSETTSENWVSRTRLDLKNSEYKSFLSKLEKGAGALAHVDDIETMASKSLCLLNLLIRDEQRRAKNLLFVLKMREDALKDFTKSQIIWLENKKKQDNTDVSTLKKKQRGALLKLQHECGEMQRMRKALLTLSERRKAALMKTRNNIELKLKNNVNVDQILLGKKKLKRNIAADRNIAPLKCFDLSSSGCDESACYKPKCEMPVTAPELPPSNTCAEKSIQTGDSICEPVASVDRSTATAAENFVAVDGGYLNILFQNLTLPQIFSSGKQYEVNEEALRNIVESSNKPHVKDLCDSDVVENFIDKIRNRDSDRSSSLSTAHSLVDEFDQYYKGLSDGSKSPVDWPDTEQNNTQNIMNTPLVQDFEVSESCNQAIDNTLEYNDKCCELNTGTVGESLETVSSSVVLITDENCECEDANVSLDTQANKNSVSVYASQAGPLPVPPGTPSPEPIAPVGADTPTIDGGSSSDGQDNVMSSMTSLSLGHSEAEELRRQQLAIEREIKALEQQQNQLLVVREIPDKPPPPYTPPNNTTNKATRMFALTDDIEDKIYGHVVHGKDFPLDPTDSFSEFVKDICEESLARQMLELSDEPWDACNLLPHKQELSEEKRGLDTIAEVQELLSGVPPTVVSGVGARRSDHIDDILFAEWRRCEPEWTALQADEAAVKSQIFEGLFQKILSETVDQYKLTVLGLTISDTSSDKTNQ